MVFGAAYGDFLNPSNLEHVKCEPFHKSKVQKNKVFGDRPCSVLQKYNIVKTTGKLDLNLTEICGLWFYLNLGR